jgi:tetratricopeptide (TPR) repeat protein
MRQVAVVMAVVLTPLAGCASFFQLQVDRYSFDEALALQRRGSRAEALALYESLNPRQRRYPGALNNIGVIHAQQGRLAEAERALALAAGIEADEAVIWTNLGVVRYLQGRHLEARATLREVSPAGLRQLARVISNGRMDWDYQDARLRVDRSRDKAEAYIKLIEQRLAARRGSRRSPGWLPGPLVYLRIHAEI